MSTIEAPPLIEGEITEPAQLSLPTFEGHKMQRVVVAFSGSVELSAYDSDDRALLDALKLGKPFDLRVSGDVGKRSHALKVKDGLPENVSTHTLVVSSLHLS